MRTAPGAPTAGRGPAVVILAIFGLMIAGGLLLAIVIRPGIEPPASIADDPLLVRGHGFYRANCATCHGVDGHVADNLATGVRPSDLASGRWKHGDRPSDLLRVIREGVAGSAMPGWAGAPEADRRAVAAYVYHLAGRTIPAALTDGSGGHERPQP